MKKKIVIIALVGSVLFGWIGTSVTHAQVVQAPYQTKEEFISYLKERIALLQQLLSLMQQLEALQKQVIANQSVITPQVIAPSAPIEQPAPVSMPSASASVQEEATSTQPAPFIPSPELELMVNGAVATSIEVGANDSMIFSWSAKPYRERLKCEVSYLGRTFLVQPSGERTVVLDSPKEPFTFTVYCVGALSGRSASKSLQVTIK